jgi:Sensors of blue-light using FAD
MLVRLLYASRAASHTDADALAVIFKQAKANNPKLGVTGVLCSSGGVFMQVLEGGRDAVNLLYHRIARDPRHGDVVLLSYEEISERSFACWSMGQVSLSRLNPALLMKYSQTAALDPYSVSGAASLALFKELAATASVIGPA